MEKTMSTSYQARSALANAHNWAIIRHSAIAHNYGWVETDDCLLSKTDKGYLETKRVKPGRYVHELTPYN